MVKIPIDQQKSITKKLLVHMAVWTLATIVNFLLISNYPVNPDPKFHFETWFVYLMIFYINYLVLMPFLFFKKRYFFFIILSLGLLAGSLTIKEAIRIKHFPKPHQFGYFEPEDRIPPPDDKEFTPPENFNKRPDIEFDRKRPGPFWERSKFFSLSSIFLIFTLSFAIKLYDQFRENESKIQTTEKEKILTELNMLKQQVNPHFLFNSLNSIYSLAHRKSEKTTQAVLKLSEILRYMIYDSERSKVSLRKEFQSVENFIELQKLRLTAKTRILTTIDFDMADKYHIEPLLIMPLIENAFKYGSDNITDSYVKINIKINDNTMFFDCENKIVNNSKKNSENSGIGLKNVLRRLELLYPDRHKIEIREEKDIFNILLRIKLEKS